MGYIPTGMDLADFAGRSYDVRLDHAAAIAVAMVQSYVRGRGFPLPDDEELPDDLAAVAVLVGARIAGNPSQMGRFEAGGQVSVVPGTFSGFTLGELAVLHRYRRRTA